MIRELSFDLVRLTAALDSGSVDPVAVVGEALRRARALAPLNVWITLRAEADLRAEAEALAGRDRRSLPLYGIPFAVKDNIDVAGLPTTAACPEFAVTPAADAPAVAWLRAAGAIPIGKTNLDQFATGLVGVRSPYGACRNPFDPDHVSGGSSSGSAVAVAAGAVSVALGTDTAGSGRVPAAFTNIVGWKGTRGLVSTRGVVPACRSLDCVTVFALTCGDAAAVAAVIGRFDALDPFSRPAAASAAAPRPAALRLGVPRPDSLAFFGDPDAPELHRAAVERFARLGATLVDVDLGPFLEAARLLYEGPWVAERTAAIGAFLAAHPTAGHPVVRSIIDGGRRFSAVEAFQAGYRLRALAREADAVWAGVDAVLTPTAAILPTVAAVEADPVGLNSRIGYYTNFMNLLDLAAVAIPSGFRPNGLPYGVTLFAPAFHDAALLTLGDLAQRAAGLALGATGHPLPSPTVAAPSSSLPGGDTVDLAVFGAHMQGLPLCPELTGRGARPIGPVATAPEYRLYALEALHPVRPGLVRTPGTGAGIAGELWAVPTAAVGAFLAGIAAPLAIGSVQLADGRWVKGFLCEAHAVAGARDITAFGGWRAWLAGAVAEGVPPGARPR